MTDKIALFFAALIAGFFVVDYVVYDWDLLLFLARKFSDLLAFLAFWR